MSRFSCSALRQPTTIEEFHSYQGREKKKLCKIKSRLRIIAKYRNICKKMPISFAVSSNRKCVVQIFSNFSCMFLNPNNFSNLNSNCSFKFLGIRNLQEQVKKAFCLPKIVLTFHCLNKIFRSLEQFFLRVGQNNFGNKTPLMIDTKRKNFACLVFEMQI